MSQHRSVPSLETRAAKLDRVFAAFFLLQWLAVIGFVWTHGAGAENLFTAIVIGASIATVPTTLIVWRPGTAATRHAIAVAQMLYGTLIVHLTGGKLGTPYHVFVSLTVLALYGDWHVVATAVGCVLFDTVGVGLLSSEIAPARWLQQLGWVAIAAGCAGIAARRAAQEPVPAPVEPVPAPVVLPEEPRRPMQLIVSDVRIGLAANDLGLGDATKIIVPAPENLDALGSAPTLRPSAVASAAQAANERSIFSDLEGEPGMFELLQDFVERLRETSVELETTRDPRELHHIAHRIQGTAASYGFAGISAASRALQDAIETDIGVASEVAHLASMCRRVRARRFSVRAA